MLDIKDYFPYSHKLSSNEGKSIETKCTIYLSVHLKHNRLPTCYFTLHSPCFMRWNLSWQKLFGKMICYVEIELWCYGRHDTLSHTLRNTGMSSQQNMKIDLLVYGKQSCKQLTIRGVFSLNIFNHLSLSMLVSKRTSRSNYESLNDIIYN